MLGYIIGMTFFVLIVGGTIAIYVISIFSVVSHTKEKRRQEKIEKDISYERPEQELVKGNIFGFDKLGESESVTRTDSQSWQYPKGNRSALGSFPLILIYPIYPLLMFGVIFLTFKIWMPILMILGGIVALGVGLFLVIGAPIAMVKGAIFGFEKGQTNQNSMPRETTSVGGASDPKDRPI